MVSAKRISRIRSSHHAILNKKEPSAADLKKEWRDSGEGGSLKEYARKHGKESWLSKKQNNKQNKKKAA
jgi:hypothetical protein